MLEVDLLGLRRRKRSMEKACRKDTENIHFLVSGHAQDIAYGLTDSRDVEVGRGLRDLPVKFLFKKKGDLRPREGKMTAPRSTADY